MAPDLNQQFRTYLQGLEVLQNSYDSKIEEFVAFRKRYDELRDSFDDLQGINEELHEVNDGLQKVNDELHEGNDELLKRLQVLKDSYDRSVVLSRSLSTLYGDTRDELARTKEALRELESDNVLLAETVAPSTDRLEIVQLEKQLQYAQDENARLKKLLKVSELLDDVRIVGTIRAKPSTSPRPESFPDEGADTLFAQQHDSEENIRHILDEDENDILGLNDTPKLTASVKNQASNTNTSPSREIGIGAANLQQKKEATMDHEQSSVPELGPRVGHTIINPDGSTTFIPMPHSLGHTRDDSSQMNQENAYTQQDFNRVAGVAIFVEDVSEEDKFEYWRSFAYNNPRHSASSWRWYYERYVRPSFVAQQAAKVTETSAPAAELATAYTPSAATADSDATTGRKQEIFSGAVVNPADSASSEPTVLEHGPRMVCVTKIPAWMTLEQVLAMLWVPDGLLFSANYIETSKMRFESPYEGNTVLLVFTTSDSAKCCASALHLLHFGDEAEGFVQTDLTLVPTASPPIGRDTQYDIDHHGATRVVGLCFETDGREEFGMEVMQAMEHELATSVRDGRMHKLPLKKSITVSGDKCITVTFEFASLAESKAAWLKFNKLHGRSQIGQKSELKCFYLPDPIGKTFGLESDAIDLQQTTESHVLSGAIETTSGPDPDEASGNVAVEVSMIKAKGVFVQHESLGTAHNTKAIEVESAADNAEESEERSTKEAMVVLAQRKLVMHAHEADDDDEDQGSDERKMKRAMLAKKEAMIAEHPILDELDKTVESDSGEEDMQTWVTMGKLNSMMVNNSADRENSNGVHSRSGRKGKKRQNKMNVVIETTASKEKARTEQIEDDIEATAQHEACEDTNLVPQAAKGDSKVGEKRQKAVENIMAKMCLHMGSTAETVDADVQKVVEKSESKQGEAKENDTTAGADQNINKTAEKSGEPVQIGNIAMAADCASEKDKLASAAGTTDIRQKEIADTLYQLCLHIDPSDILGTAQKLMSLGTKTQIIEKRANEFQAMEKEALEQEAREMEALELKALKLQAMESNKTVAPALCLDSKNMRSKTEKLIDSWGTLEEKCGPKKESSLATQD